MCLAYGNSETPLLDRMRVEPHLYRQAMSRYAGHVQIVTTEHQGRRRGVTITAACSVSDDPATLLVCLNSANERNSVFLESGIFAVNTLGLADQNLADIFSGKTPGMEDERRFLSGDWATLTTGAPILTSAMASFDCRIIEAKTVATHMILFGEVVGVAAGSPDSPLLYLDRSYRSL